MCTKNIRIKFQNINRIVKFANASTKTKCEVTVRAGKYDLDGKSIMNLFTLDITRPVRVTIKGGKKEVGDLVDLYRLYGIINAPSNSEVINYAKRTAEVRG